MVDEESSAKPYRQSGRVQDRAQRATHSVDVLKEEAADLYERGKERALVLKNDARHLVQDRPLASVLSALGLGFALGLLLARR
jgi:ElaB/YqjD/DUF883 family membrane-anchored ribosome-binding protein